MSGLLLSGPAGAGKSKLARQEMERSVIPAVVIDFQAIYASMLLLERDESGRYPEREGRHSHLLPLAEYLRRAAITAAANRELFPIVTNSDGDALRRRTLLNLLGPGATETIVDPGRQVVVTRLSESGSLTKQCADAIDRWYGRLNA